MKFTKRCPNCQQVMIREYTGEIKALEHEWIWWCACGYEEQGGFESKKARLRLLRWELAQAEDEARRLSSGVE